MSTDLPIKHPVYNGVLPLSAITSRQYPVTETTTDFRILKGILYDHIPEVKYQFNEFYNFECEVDIESNYKVFVDIVGVYRYDERRFWRLAVVRFQDDPVMVIQNGGREGDDASNSLILDKKLYFETITYINCLCTLALDMSAKRDDKTLPIKTTNNLAEFYGENVFTSKRYF